MKYLTIKMNEGGKDVHILEITDHFGTNLLFIMGFPRIS